MGCRERELSILVTDDPGIRALNRRWLGRDRATNVLAFSQGPGMPVPVLGDVVISAEACVRRAKRRRVDPEAEVRRVLVHGILHLAGYDHVGSTRRREAMVAREDEMIALIARQVPEPLLAQEGAGVEGKRRGGRPGAGGGESKRRWAGGLPRSPGARARG